MGVEEVVRQYHGRVDGLDSVNKIVYTRMCDASDKTEEYDASFELQGMLDLGLEKVELGDHFEFIIYRNSSGKLEKRLEKAVPRELTEEEQAKLKALGKGLNL